MACRTAGCAARPCAGQVIVAEHAMPEVLGARPTLLRVILQPPIWTGCGTVSSDTSWGSSHLQQCFVGSTK